MTTFQHLDVAASGALAGEDAMELSTEIDRRYLGDEDIDIDLGPEGRSPYAQEDEYMLEDAVSVEDCPVYGSQAEGNDDEMTDEVVLPGIIPDGQGQDNNVQFEEQDEFDILVDDEDLNDVDDTMAIPDGSVPQPTTHPHSSEPSSEYQSHGIFASQSAPDMNAEVEHGMLYNSEQIAQDPSILNPFSVSGTINHPGDAIDPPNYADDSGVSKASFVQRKLDIRPVNDEEVDYSNERVSLNHDAEPASSLEGNVLKEAENQESEKGLGFDPEGMGNVAIQSGSPTQEKYREDNALSYVVSEYKLENATDSGHSIQVESPTQGTTHHDTHQDESGTFVQDRTANDSLNHDNDNEVEEEISVRHRASLHPVIVLYQQSEIFLFPPHDNDDQYAQTYFLEDESLATQDLKVLLEALRLVLADSINEHDELEINFFSLDLDINEASNASYNTSLSQIVDIYLQLQHNDGTEHPDALQMTLTTKLSFSNRLEYLYSAIAGGVGFSDIATLEKAKETDRPTEQTEGHNSTSHDILESFSTEVEKPTSEEEQKKEEQDGTEEFSSDPSMISNEQRGPEESTRVFALKPLEPQQQAQKEADLHERSKYNHESRDSNTSDEQEHTQNATVETFEDHSNSHTDNVRDSEANSPPQNVAERIAGGEQDEELRASSTTSSTLDGDEFDIGGGGSYGQTLDNGMPTNDHNNFDRVAGETDDDHWSIVDAIGDEYGKEPYDGNHGGGYDAGPEGDTTTFDMDTAHLQTELNTNDSSLSFEGKYEDSVDITKPAIKRPGSGGSSEIDKDEITYDDEDELEENDDAENTGTRNSVLSAEEQDSKSGLDNSDELVARPDSLKRLRPGEDDELSSLNNTQEIKRFRSE